MSTKNNPFDAVNVSATVEAGSRGKGYAPVQIGMLTAAAGIDFILAGVAGKDVSLPAGLNAAKEMQEAFVQRVKRLSDEMPTVAGLAALYAQACSCGIIKESTSAKAIDRFKGHVRADYGLSVSANDVISKGRAEALTKHPKFRF